MARRRRFSNSEPNIWPGFTDALAGLVVALVFLLVLFFLFEVVLSRQVSGQETQIQKLQSQVARLVDRLGETQQRSERLEQQLTQSRDRSERLRSELAEREKALEAMEARKRETEKELAQARRDLEATESALASVRREARGAEGNLQVLTGQVAALNQRIERLEKALTRQEEERQAAEEQLAQTRRELASREATVAEQRNRIETMAARIQTQLLERVEELARYRSEFFGRLREVFADRPDIKIRGDRFVFQSEILFPSGKAELAAGGREELTRFVDVYQEVANRIPEGMGMIIQVEGHTDRVPIQTSRFRSNWELSTARALSVVRFLIDQGLPPKRLAAAGYGEYHPLTPGRTPVERRQNRRIELKITQR
jgi:chemotaxis protein MotB